MQIGASREVRAKIRLPQSPTAGSALRLYVAQRTRWRCSLIQVLRSLALLENENQTQNDQDQDQQQQPFCEPGCLTDNGFPDGDRITRVNKNCAALSSPITATSRVQASRSGPAFTPAACRPLAYVRTRWREIVCVERSPGMPRSMFLSPQTDNSDSSGGTRQLSA